MGTGTGDCKNALRGAAGRKPRAGVDYVRRQREL